MRTHVNLIEEEQDKRRADIRTAFQVMSSPIGLGVSVNVEDKYLLSNAMCCYIHGADAGAIFCAHASCERDLAALVAARGEGCAAEVDAMGSGWFGDILYGARAP